MKKKKREDDFTQKIPRICPVCQHTDFVWGSAKAAHTYPFMFHADLKAKGPPPANMWEHFARSLRHTGKTMNARQCRDCGNIQLFAERP